jgi:ankyrin repeat protein
MDKLTKRLFKAIEHRDIASVRAAIQAGADVNAITAFDSSSQTTLLHCAAGMGDSDIIGLLIENGADINAKGPEQTTPLHWAAAANEADAVLLLIEKGADVSPVDTWEETPAQYAAKRGHNQLATILDRASKEQQGHAGRVTDERKDKGPPQVGG